MQHGVGGASCRSGSVRSCRSGRSFVVWRLRLERTFAVFAVVLVWDRRARPTSGSSVIALVVLRRWRTARGVRMGVGTAARPRSKRALSPCGESIRAGAAASFAGCSSGRVCRRFRPPRRSPRSCAAMGCSTDPAPARRAIGFASSIPSRTIFGRWISRAISRWPRDAAIRSPSSTIIPAMR
jgi:hypothetical protein